MRHFDRLRDVWKTKCKISPKVESHKLYPVMEILCRISSRRWLMKFWSRDKVQTWLTDWYSVSCTCKCYVLYPFQTEEVYRSCHTVGGFVSFVFVSVGKFVEWTLPQLLIGLNETWFTWSALSVDFLMVPFMQLTSQSTELCPLELVHLPGIFNQQKW